MSLTFEFKVSDAELVRASRLMTLRQRETRLSMWFCGIVAVVGVAYVVTAVVAGDHPGWPVLAALSFCLLILYSIIFTSPRNVVQMLRKGSRASEGAVQIILDEEGVEISSLGAKGSLEWANVVQCVETREFFLLYLSKGFAQVLPKRVVDGAVLEDLREALGRWLQGRFEAGG